MPITTPNNGQATVPTSTEAATGLALKYAEMYIDGAAISRHYGDFDKSVDQYGAILESVRIPATASTAVNRDSTVMPPPSYPAPKIRYFSNWTEKQYVKSIPDDQLEKTVGNADEFARLTATIINSNAEGERMEADAAYKDMFFQAYGGSEETLLKISDGPTTSVEAGFLKANNQYEFLTELSAENFYEKVYTEIKRVAEDMTFNNSKYSDGFTAGARMEDLRLILPTKFTSGASVQFLSRLYNLSEIGELPKIIKSDGCYDSGNYSNAPGGVGVALIVDVRAIGRVKRPDRAEAYRPPLRWRTDFATKVEDMYYYLPSYKAYAIVIAFPAGL